MSAEKHYAIRTYGVEGGEADFYAGALADGRQALMGQYGPEQLVCVPFDAEGWRQGVLTRAVPVREGQAEPGSAAAWGAQHALAWQAELGWRAGPVRVRRFALPEHCVYIADYPGWGIRLQADPYFYPSEEEREALRQQLALWEQAGKFVFWWGKDYFMSKDGEVLST